MLIVGKSWLRAALRARLRLLVFILALLPGPQLLAVGSDESTEQSGFRRWSTSNGVTSRGELRFVELVDGTVRLERKDNGQIVELPLERLSEADRRLARQFAAAVAEDRPAKKPAASAGGSVVERQASEVVTSGPKLVPLAEGPTLFREHCRACHEQGKAEGGFDVDDLLGGPTIEKNIAGWRSVLERIVARDMPPEDAERRPTEKEYAGAESWLRDQLSLYEAFSLLQQPRPMRRLNNAEYDQTVREVFGLDGIAPSAAFPPDDVFEGFTNVGEALNLSAVLIEQYLASGEAIARLAVLDGAQPEKSVRTYTHGNKDYGLAMRGHDPGGAMGKVGGVDAWLGDHLWASSGGGPGVYRVALHFTPRNLGVRPGYTPHFQIRFDSDLVSEGDVRIEEGKPAVFERMVMSGGRSRIDFRWSNGFPSNGGLRAESRLPNGPDGKPRTENAWRVLNEDYKRRLEKDPNTPYPFPYLTDLRLEVEGPLYPKGWPLSRFQRENEKAIAAGDWKKVAGWLLPRLYRRPATSEEIGDFAQVAQQASLAYANPKLMPEASKAPAHDGLRLALARALASPHFLFHVEPGPVGRSLDDHELAARLSYFLWGGPPDDALMKVAAAGTLRGTILEQVRRMIADPRSDAFVDRFATEWLGLTKISTIMPEDVLYKRFDKQGLMRQDFAAEPKAMLRHLLHENGSLFDLLDCDYAFLNDRLADHYHLPSLWSLVPEELPGFSPVSGGDLRKVSLPEGRRGGLVTTAAFLATTSENTRTSPVKRGAWILERLFNRPPPPPPPSVNAVLPDDGTGETASSMVRSHVSAANCAGCHNRIDPLGLALEHYDAIGEWRDDEPVWVDPANPIRNQEAIKKRHKLYAVWSPVPRFPIDDAFAMGAVKGNGADAVKQYLVANRERFATGFVEKLAIYALGRRLLLTDEPQLHAVRDAALADEFRFQKVIEALVQSDLFQKR
jgi:mono/diheme cytochrome c family protein